MSVASRGARATLPRSLVFALGVALTACTTSSSRAPIVTPRPAPSTPPPASGPTASGSTTIPSPAGSVAAFDPNNVKPMVTTVVGGLQSPVDVTDAGDGSGRLFVVEQGGRIRIVHDGKLVDRPFLDISDRISSGGERGLLGLAFHPGYPNDPRFFVDYTDRDGNTVVASYRVSAND